MKKAAVIGNPIDHSWSPLIHSFWLKEAGINAIYEKIKVSSDELESFILTASEKGYSGINVTVPHKEEALKHLDIAIGISPSESEAYREIIKIGQSHDDRIMTSKYCEIYNKALSGGSLQSHYSPLFNSFNNDKFAIKLISKNNKKSTNYLSATTLLNEINIYEFLLSTELFEIDQLNLYFSSAEALKIKFKKINYYDDNKVNELDYKDLTVTSQNSYIEESEDGVSVFLIPKKDEIIRFNDAGKLY